MVTAKKFLHLSVWAQTFPRFRMPLLQALRDRGHTVEVACPEDHPYVDMIRDAGFTVHPMDLPRGFAVVETAAAISRLARLLRQERYDVLHAHQTLGGLVGIPAARLAGTRVVFYTTGGLKSNEGMHPFLRTVVMQGEGVLYSLADAVFSVNQQDMETIKQSPFLARRKFIYAGARGGCGIDTARYFPAADPAAKSALRPKLSLPEDALLIGVVARVVWEKGFAELFQAFRQLLASERRPPCKLVIVGTGSDLNAVKDRAAELGVAGETLFLGNRLDVPDILRALDVFVLPSYREGMPVALLEAMASGLAAVASDVRGSREVIRHGVNGLLVPPKEPAALAEALGNLALNAPLRSTLGQNACLTVEQRYSEQSLLPPLMNAYESLIARKFPAAATAA